MQSKNMSPTCMSSMLRLQVIFVLGVVSETARNLQFFREANVDSTTSTFFFELHNGIGNDDRVLVPYINLSPPIGNLSVNNNKNYFSNPDPANHYVFSIDTNGDKTLDAILPYQVTPSVEDISRCGSYWKQHAEPEGYNGSQSTHCYPLSAVGRLQIQYPGIPLLGNCTGTVIAPHTVLTAAHCFVITPVNIEFIPGQFGKYKPFGSFKNGEVAKSDSFNIRTGASDYAVVTFSENIGKLTGWLGIESIKDCDKTKYDLTVVGYSVAKQWDRMWTSKCQNVIVDSCATSQNLGLFAHECDTGFDTSGAPLIQKDTIIGLHSSYKSSTQKNWATYISEQIMRFIQTHLEMD